jgi:hypothetical protein
MGLSEAAYRGRQEAAKLIDRLRPTRHPIEPLTWSAPRAWTTPAASGPIGAIGADDPRPSFPGPDSGLGDALLRRLGSSGREVVATADAICRHRFDLLGYRALSFGDPIDWHLDPVSGRRAPRVHWSRIDPLDAELVGDHKVVWELNRHQWLVTLAQAWRLTGDRRYAREAADRMTHWIAANPYGVGINWASSLEASLRVIAWCWTLALLRGAAAFTRDAFDRVVASIRAHTTHVERYLSYYFSPNTHLTGEALGLFYAGLVWRELPESARWRDVGRRILIDESERQVTTDGVYVEQATCYQRYTIEIYLHFLILATHHGVAVPAGVRERVERLLDVLVSLCGRDGAMPAIGDGDGGWLLPLTPRGPADCRGVFGLAAAYLGRADCAWAAGGLAPEVVWMLGEDGRQRVEALEPAPPPAPPASRAYAVGGYAVMRSGWDADAHQLIFDVGPLGCAQSGAHGHADLLSVQVRAFGDDYLVDPGTFCYSGDHGWRAYFRGTAAHSTIGVDGRGQAEPVGPFGWRTRPAARLRAWRATPRVDYAEAEHDAYADLPHPVRHRRRVVFVKPAFWLLIDDLEGHGEHALDVRFQFSPRPVRSAGAPWIAASGDGGRGLWLGLFAPTPCDPVVREGESDPKAGWVSSDYGTRRPAPAAIYALTATLPVRLVTILLPSADLTDAPPRVALRRAAHHRHEIVGIGLPDYGEAFEFDARRVVRTTEGTADVLS